MAACLAEHIWMITEFLMTIVTSDSNYLHEKSKTTWEAKVNNAIN
jgi:hypothetical protein